MNTSDHNTRDNSILEEAHHFHPIHTFGALPKPPDIETLGIDIAVGTLAALHCGPQAGPIKGTGLLVPGFTGSKEDFYDLLPLLAQRGWDVWAISQRGQADSVSPLGIGAYDRHRVAGDVIEVARLIARKTGARRVHLLGHSFGGTVSQAAVIDDATPFASLTLMCSGPHGWPGRHDDEYRLLAENPDTDLWRITNPQLASLPDDKLSTQDLFLRQRSERTGHDQLIGALNQLGDVHDTTFEVKDTGLPVMVFHGVDDPAWPQDWQKRMARILDARYAVIPEAAHCPNSENPIPTADLIDDFWSTVASSEA